MRMLPYGTRYKYPHMAPNDVAIWERFMDKYPARFTGVVYDLALGAVPSFVRAEGEVLSGDIGRLYQRRIDALAFEGKKVILIEVKPNAGLAAIGQVRGYASLYKAYIDPAAEVVPMLLTDNVRPDIPMLAYQEGVELVVV